MAQISGNLAAAGSTDSITGRNLSIYIEVASGDAVVDVEVQDPVTGNWIVTDVGSSTAYLTKRDVNELTLRLTASGTTIDVNYTITATSMTV